MKRFFQELTTLFFVWIYISLFAVVFLVNIIPAIILGTFFFLIPGVLFVSLAFIQFEKQGVLKNLHDDFGTRWGLVLLGISFLFCYIWLLYTKIYNNNIVWFH